MEVLEGTNDPVENQKGMMDVDVSFYYKDLFFFGSVRKEDSPNIHLAQDFWEHEEIVTEEENALLTAFVSESEIKEAVFSC